MLFFRVLINVIFDLFLPFFAPSTWKNKKKNLLPINGALFALWQKYLKQLLLFFSLIEATHIFEQMSSFRILSFQIFSLNILIWTTCILWICCFLIAQHSVLLRIDGLIVVLQNFSFNIIGILWSHSTTYVLYVPASYFMIQLLIQFIGSSHSLVSLDYQVS